MTIKSDLWIRRAAREQSLITPFEPTLVRNVDGRRIISAGCSSYGYDMRLADDGFRVFSPVHGREIDPKKFDEESLVEPPVRTTDDGSRYYLMPPHSYALGVSVETFQMPRNVTGVCLGKCLTRDAQIVDAASGDLLSIADFTTDGQTLAYEGGRIAPRHAFAAISQGIKPTFVLETRLGHKITATSNHPFLTGSGWRQLSELGVGSRIAAARRINVFGKHEMPEWEATLLGLMISEGQCHTPGSSPTFTSVDDAMISAAASCVRSGLGGDLSHNGSYGYRLVNRRGRGGIVEKNKATCWLASYGLNVGALEKFVPSCVFRATKPGVALFLRALFSGDGSIYVNHPRGRSQFYAGLEYCSSSEKLARDVQHLMLRFGIVSRLRKKRTTHAPTFIVEVFRRDDIKTFLDEIGFLPGSAKDLKARETIRPLLDNQATGRRRAFDTLPAEFWGVMKAEAQILNTSLYASGIHVHNRKDVRISSSRALLRTTRTQTSPANSTPM
jgi:deoxycytidine triphosphate deaminase